MDNYCTTVQYTEYSISGVFGGDFFGESDPGIKQVLS